MQAYAASFINSGEVALTKSSIEDKSASDRNVSPTTTVSIPAVNLKNKGNEMTTELLLAEKMHKSRYQCKMNLQICALQSQLGKH